VTVIRTENFVVCDFCNEGADTFGGVLVGGTAICGNCSEKQKMTINDEPNMNYEFADEITKYFNNKKTFQENVEQHRLEQYGTRDAITIITDWEV
tara:strand:- start:8577 stop:8861 length:285 start_codon:yes stop_codon:yes gene_type:complete